MKSHPAEKIKILLCQVRQDKLTLEEEKWEFIRYGGLREDQIESLNVFTKPEFSPNIANQYDSVFVGGSSDASVLEPEEYTFNQHLEALLLHCLKKDIPVLASCYGFQVATLALGGKIVRRPDKQEIGIFPLKLTTEASQDPLLAGISSPLKAVCGHQEGASVLPPNARVLVSSDLWKYQAFCIPGKPFYAFQFHPEVDYQDLIARITRYQERYLESDSELTKIIRENPQEDTSKANDLVRKFINRIIIEGQKPI